MSTTARPWAGTVSCSLPWLEMKVLGRRHRSGGAELGDLRLREIARRAAHRVEGLEHIAVVVVHAPDLDGGCRRDVLEVESKVFAGPAGPVGMVYVAPVPVGGA